MRKLPEGALPVVEVLRRDVPKPDTLPNFIFRGGWLGGRLRWGQALPCCPMGLHKGSACATPMSSSDFAGGCCTGNQVYEFLYWWDDLPEEHAEEAVNAIWRDNDKEV